MDKKQLDDLLTTAIASEVEANGFYGQVAERATNPHVRQIFTELAAEGYLVSRRGATGAGWPGTPVSHRADQVRPPSAEARAWMFR